MELTKRKIQILNKALELIGAGGIQNLTIRNISREIGFTEAAVYRHFSSKAEIIQTIISRFDENLKIPPKGRGWKVIADIAMQRISQVVQTPALAKTLFSEELFQEDPAFSQAILSLRKRHRERLLVHFQEAVEDGEIRSGIPFQTLFCIVFGPIRFLVKQWGMRNHSFDLKRKGQELLDTMKQLLAPVTHEKRSDSHK